MNTSLPDHTSPSNPSRPLSLPIFEPIQHAGLLIILIACYLLPGIIGHDPWKQDETYIFGIIHHLLNTGDWVVPTVAGEAFMEKPPLYYWLAALCAKLFSSFLSLHDGARLATTVFMGIACWGVGRASQQWWGKNTGLLGALLLLSSFGILLHSHMMLTDIPALTGMALALWGFSLLPQQKTASNQKPMPKHQETQLGGALIGIGAGFGFLAKGVLIPGVIGLTALALPLFFRSWRTRCTLHAFLMSILASLPFLLIWPIALYHRSPTLFMEWFWMNNVGRFLGFSVANLGAPHEPGFWWITIPWFTFPVLPLACLTLWHQRNSALKQAPIQVACLLSSILMGVLATAASARANYALPLLAPISLLAVPGLAYLSQRTQRIWDWIARLLFIGLTSTILYVWVYKLWKGMAPDWSFLNKHLPVHFTETLSLWRLGTALFLLLLALWGFRHLSTYIQKYNHPYARGLLSWMIGLSLFWGMVSMLWMPWLDEAKSYRAVFYSMKKAMPSSYTCMESSGLGESERAMLRYFLGVNTFRREIKPNSNCSLLLIDGLADSPPSGMAIEGWKQQWNGARNGDTRERLWLYSK
jgi:4-amino-4-deoxy-L-arabinose transferase-like glycosyltransferase